MGSTRECGATLIEAVVAAGIVSLLGGVVAAVAVYGSHAAGHDPIDAALRDAVAREMPIAVDALKYQGGALIPRSIATTIPTENGTHVAATIAISTVAASGGGMAVTIAATAAQGGQRASLTRIVAARAALPGDSIVLSGLAPAPTGAP
jgi:hypothetical protein